MYVKMLFTLKFFLSPVTSVFPCFSTSLTKYFRSTVSPGKYIALSYAASNHDATKITTFFSRVI